MKGSKVKKTLAALAGLAGLAASGGAHALAWYFQTPGSQLARDIDHLHQYVMWLIIVIFVGVFGFMFYACWAHRKSKGHPAEQFHENTTVEILWTVIPAIYARGGCCARSRRARSRFPCLAALPALHAAPTAATASVAVISPRVVSARFARDA